MKIGVIGIGYVGLPLIESFCDRGVSCIGIDIDSNKVQSLNSGRSFLDSLPDKKLQKFIEKKLFFATSDYEKLSNVDAVIICVPTPMDVYRKPNLDYVINSVNSSIPFLRENTLLSLESTTYPGTSREILKPLLEKKGFIVGENVYLCFSPEREDPGNLEYNMSNTPKVVSGFSEKCLKKAIEVYSIVCEKLVPVSSLEVAETCKLIENIQRSVNIGLMNELKTLTTKMNINIFEVIDAAATKPFGFTKYYPGPGVGGHCIPIDPFYLTYKAKEYNIDTKFIELAGEINRSMPEFVINNIADLLNSKGLSISKSKILCLGISYKKNVGDTRESPPAQIFDSLIKLGAQVDFSDPYFNVFPKTKNFIHKSLSVSLTKENLSHYDVVLILTDHDSWDYQKILDHSNLIVDTRGRYHSLGISSKKIINS